MKEEAEEAQIEEEEEYDEESEREEDLIEVNNKKSDGQNHEPAKVDRFELFNAKPFWNSDSQKEYYSDEELKPALQKPLPKTGQHGTFGQRVEKLH